MNNSQKLEKTITTVLEVRKSIEEPLKKQLSAAKDIEEELKISEKTLVSMGLDFQGRKPILMYSSTKYGLYQQMKYNKKMRVRTVPICFVVTLYEEELKRTFPKEEIQIPFELRGFWKMERAMKFLEDFVGFQDKIQNTLLCEYRRLKYQKVVKAADYFEILEEFVSFSTLNSKWKKEISYNGRCFVVNTRNVKLDVVPLCKILTKYYANVIRKIDGYLKYNASKLEAQNLQKIKGDFKSFMDKYFVDIA